MLYNSQVTNHFQCILRADIDLGSAVIDLEVNADLIHRAFQKEIRDNSDYDLNQDYYYDHYEDYNADCIPGTNCESEMSERVANF